jgi:hypothetical protein
VVAFIGLSKYTELNFIASVKHYAVLVRCFSAVSRCYCHCFPLLFSWQQRRNTRVSAAEADLPRCFFMEKQRKTAIAADDGAWRQLTSPPVSIQIEALPAGC